MNDELFAELLESVRQGGAILRGDAEPSRTFKVDAPNIRNIRKQYNLSQEKFASMLGIIPFPYEDTACRAGLRYG
jgi:putative transcriptional regulator